MLLPVRGRGIEYLPRAMPAFAIRRRNRIIPRIGGHHNQYPKVFGLLTKTQSRIPENCAYTSQHVNPDAAQTQGPSPTSGLGIPNGGLQVVNPSKLLYDLIQERMASDTAVMGYEFADQSLLSDLFSGRWVALPYTYNALKTSRETHAPIWRDDEVKNMHYLLSPKPWDERLGEESNSTHRWWIEANMERLKEEKERGIDDGF